MCKENKSGSNEQTFKFDHAKGNGTENNRLYIEPAK